MRLFTRTLPLAAAALIVGAVSFASPRAAHAIGYAECDGLTFTEYTLSADCLSVIEANPEPTLIEVPLDGYTLGNYSYWHVTTEGAANVYDAPNGGVIRQIEDGFNFVIATDTTTNPGWIGIQGGGWMAETDIAYYEPSYHRGVQMLDGLEHPFGWVMFALFAAAFPGGQQELETERFLDKYDRFNVYGQVADDTGVIWYLIGPDQWVEQRWVAVAKSTERPEGVTGRWVAVDLYEQTLVAFENDTPVFATLIATGLPNFDTNEGVFNVWARAIRDPMSGGTGSPAAYALQDVPWVMYFDGGISLHGTYWHNGFGYRRSHGCVNLSISDARFIYEWTNENPPDAEGNPTTFVYVYSSGEYGQFGITQA